MRIGENYINTDLIAWINDAGDHYTINFLGCDRQYIRIQKGGPDQDEMRKLLQMFDLQETYPFEGPTWVCNLGHPMREINGLPFHVHANDVERHAK